MNWRNNLKIKNREKYYCGQYKQLRGDPRSTFVYFLKEQVNAIKAKKPYELIVCRMDGKIATVNEEYLMKYRIKWWEFWK